MFFVALKHTTSTYMAFGPINPSSARHPIIRPKVTLWPSKTNTGNEGKKKQDRQRQNYAWLS